MVDDNNREKFLITCIDVTKRRGVLYAIAKDDVRVWREVMADLPEALYFVITERSKNA